MLRGDISNYLKPQMLVDLEVLIKTDYRFKVIPKYSLEPARLLMLKRVSKEYQIVINAKNSVWIKY
ncbi:MAG: hypothetical protein R3Y64_11585, partial [Peptostreptococcaceae bacterium]